MVRYGILGFGHHSIKRLLPGFAGARQSQLAGLWRRDPVKAAENSRAFGLRAFPSAEALCASPEIDAVFVASPDSLHRDHVLLAAAHGKPVLCEKPLAMNTAEAAEMLAATQKAGVAFGVAQNMRYNRSVMLVRDWIAEGRIGRPVLAHSQFCYDTEQSPRAWINDPTLALGGAIGDVGIHCIDALRFVLDADVAAIGTLALRDGRSGAVETTASMSIEFTTGVMGCVSVTARAAYRSLLEVAGETGVILAENGLTVDHPVDVVLRQGEKVLATERVSNEDGYSRMLDGFSAAIEGNGAAYLAPGREGVHNQQVLDAAYRSWRTGAKQTL